ncbi:MAG: hypothetical protein O3B24_09085, partial [Verrucomicrobia bacterium]|nr:hypothetical protein [Verrucomicrobiota bacterium]
MYEYVVIGQKDAKTRMRVIPPYNRLPAKLAVLFLMDSNPGFLSECNVRATLGRAFAGDGS